jgi:sodium/hydrogen antiporter
MPLLTIFLALLFFYSLGSQRLARTVLTAPILFTAAGLLVHIVSPGLPAHQGSLELFLRIAEIGLVLLLFTDACRTDLRVLKDIRNLPTRLLSVGMLLTILLGAIAALATFSQLTLWEAGILSAILAPTDAGLGQIIVTSPRVPVRIRQALNVEAGLNDGLSVPFLLFFMALAGGERDRVPRRTGSFHRGTTWLGNMHRCGNRNRWRFSSPLCARSTMDKSLV